MTNPNTAPPVTHVDPALELGSGSTRIKDYVVGFAFVVFLSLLGLVWNDARGRILESEARERERDRSAQDAKAVLLEKIATQREENARRWQQLDDLGKDLHEMKTDIHDIKVELTRRRAP